MIVFRKSGCVTIKLEAEYDIKAAPDSVNMQIGTFSRGKFSAFTSVSIQGFSFGRLAISFYMM